LLSHAHRGAPPAATTHCPCPLHECSGSPSHEGTLQSSAVKPALQLHTGVPLLTSHEPRPLHTGEPAHVKRSHWAPAQRSSHTHVGSTTDALVMGDTQLPWPEQIGWPVQ